MGSLNNPKPWVPYINTKDCSQGFCSLYCPQWCYIIFPPPPPLDFPNDNSGPNFSPLVIAIIGILASAFLLVSYYAIISKYCGNMDSPRRRENHQPNEELEDNQEDPSNNIHEPWHIATNGLDENLIKSITVCKYRKGDGLIDETDCSVCLSEFEEDESVRLLPKCSHAFHVVCIDTWLKSHSNCPNCRANIIFVNASPIPSPLPVIESPLNDENDNDENADVSEDIETVVSEEEISRSEVVQKSQLRALSDLGCSKERETIIEIIDEDSDKKIRRSVSMNYLCQSRVSIADVLRLKQGEEEDFHIGSSSSSSSRRPAIEMSKSCYGNRILHCVMSPIAMKRSFSSGRFSFSRRSRGRNLLIPL